MLGRLGIALLWAIGGYIVGMTPRAHYLLTPFCLDQVAPELGRLKRTGWEINTPTIPGGSQSGQMAVIHRHLADMVAGSIGRGEQPVSIAGDCCATIGVLSGLKRAGIAPVLVWLDAHGDFNTYETTITGFLGGMPLAMITGRGDDTLLKSTGLKPLPDTDVYLADARDLDPRERELLDRSAVRRFDRVSALVDQLPADRPIYVHFDCDILDPADAPAMRYHVPGGPSLQDIVAMGDRLRQTGRVAAVSVTTWDLESDLDGRTGRACMEGLHALTGAIP